MKGIGVVGAIFLAVILLGLFFVSTTYTMTGKLPFMQVVPAPAETPQIQIQPPACDPQATVRPELRFAIRNPLNTSGVEYLTTTARIYSGDYSTSDSIPGSAFKGTLAGLSTGLQPRGSGFACDCGQIYTIVLPAADDTVTSKVFTMKCERNDNTIEVTTPEQAELIFNVYDEMDKAYVYEYQDSSAGTWSPAGSVWYSTTSNSTGKTIGQDGYYIYTISTKTNATAAVDRQYTDQRLYLAFDIAQSNDWQEPSITSPGVTITRVDCPTKIANLGYEYCYDITKDGKPLILEDSQVDFKIEQHAIAGVDPDDNVVIGFFTSGWYVSTIDAGAKLGVSKDDGAKTLVFSNMSIELDFV